MSPDTMLEKNLIFLHLESISWQTVNAFPESFPNLRKVIQRSRLYHNYFSSATSTRMVLAYLFHANDYEFDHVDKPGRPAANNPGIFRILEKRGYSTSALCVSAYERRKFLPDFSETCPPIWSTSDFSSLFQKIEAQTSKAPFALFFWNLTSHIEHAHALASYTDNLEDLIGGACAVADHALGKIFKIIERKELLSSTTIIVYGDHGDDYWTHGFKSGMLHGTEPYTSIVHTPLIICDPDIEKGDDYRMASTIDIVPTVLQLLGVKENLAFTYSGRSLLDDKARAVSFSQNYTASQPDGPVNGVRQSFACVNRSYILLVSSLGLELFNYRMDPGNHCNLLHFFKLNSDGVIKQDYSVQGVHSHFHRTVHRMWNDHDRIAKEFRLLHTALCNNMESKHSYVLEKGESPTAVFNPDNLRKINRAGRDRFFQSPYD